MELTDSTFNASIVCADTKSRSCLVVLDLPSLHTHPSAATLLKTLDSLATKPSTFDGGFNEENGSQGRLAAVDGIPRYLTAIVSNGLDWIEDESIKEKIWETASERLSERSGRTG